MLLVLHTPTWEALPDPILQTITSCEQNNTTVYYCLCHIISNVLQLSTFFFLCVCVLYNSSTACNVAIKILAPKFGRLSYHHSKAMRMDWFNGMLKHIFLDCWISLKPLTTCYFLTTDDFLIGTATEVFMLKSATNVFPTEIMMKGKFYFIGRILQLLEVQHDTLALQLSLKINVSSQSWTVIIHFSFYAKVGYPCWRNQGAVWQQHPWI